MLSWINCLVATLVQFVDVLVRIGNIWNFEISGTGKPDWNFIWRISVSGITNVPNETLETNYSCLKGTTSFRKSIVRDRNLRIIWALILIADFICENQSRFSYNKLCNALSQWRFKDPQICRKLLSLIALLAWCVNVGL